MLFLITMSAITATIVATACLIMISQVQSEGDLDKADGYKSATTPSLLKSIIGKESGFVNSYHFRDQPLEGDLDTEGGFKSATAPSSLKSTIENKAVPDYMAIKRESKLKLADAADLRDDTVKTTSAPEGSNEITKKPTNRLVGIVLAIAYILGLLVR